MTKAQYWFYHATHWDVTHTLPPPPQCPARVIAEEQTRGMLSGSLAPYTMDYWLQRCEHWSKAVHSKFRYPEVQPTPQQNVDAHLVLRFIAQ